MNTFATTASCDQDGRSCDQDGRNEKVHPVHRYRASNELPQLAAANLHLVSDVRGLPGPGDGRKRVPSRCSLPPSRGCRWGTGDVAGSLIAVAANPCRSWCQRPPAWWGGFEPERGGEVAGRSGCVLAMLRAIASIACAESPITRPPRGRA